MHVLPSGLSARGATPSAGRLRLGLVLGAAVATALTGLAATASAKTPGHTYCFNGVCHRVKSIAETRAMVGKTVVWQASFYDDAKRDRFNPSNQTSSGEYFRADRPDNAASPILPNGTRVLVWHAGTRKAVVVRINNAGPYHGRRLLDLSRGAARALGISGVAKVHARVLAAPTAAEASYRRGRKYAPVPGYIGSFGSLDLAMADATRTMGLGTASTLVAAASPPAPARKPIGAAVVADNRPASERNEPARLVAGVAASAGGSLVARPAEADSSSPPVTPGPVLAGVADAGDRVAAARREAAMRLALVEFDAERRRASRAQRARPVPAIERGRQDAPRALKPAQVAKAGRRPAEARGAVEAKAKAKTKAKSQIASAQVDDGDTAPKPVARPAPAPLAKPVEQPEPDRGWVKLALTIQ